MKALILGCNGQLGKALCRELGGQHSVHSLSRTDLNLANYQAIERVLGALEWDVLINAAAYTAVDAAENDPTEAMQVNSRAPGKLAQLCAERGSWMIHYSTDYVFDGRQHTPYQTTDATNPLNAYGRSKLRGEQAVAAATQRHVILRTSWLYAPGHRNFVSAIIAQLAADRIPRVVDDQVGTPTPASDLARATAAVLEALAGAGAEDCAGTYHATPLGEASWYAFADAIARFCHKRKIGRGKIQPVMTTELQQAAQRPKYSVLQNQAFCERFGFTFPVWSEALEQSLREHDGWLASASSDAE